MKNGKNIVAATIMMAALTFGTTFAHAGIIISKRGDRATCSDDKGGVIDKIKDLVVKGIIISKTGIIISKTGIIISKTGSTCDSRRTGIIIS